MHGAGCLTLTEGTEIAVLIGSRVWLSVLDELSQVTRVVLDMHMKSSAAGSMSCRCTLHWTA